jgi:hypothetical protein
MAKHMHVCWGVAAHMSQPVLPQTTYISITSQPVLTQFLQHGSKICPHTCHSSHTYSVGSLLPKFDGCLVSLQQEHLMHGTRAGVGLTICVLAMSVARCLSHFKRFRGISGLQVVVMYCRVGVMQWEAASGMFQRWIVSATWCAT